MKSSYTAVFSLFFSLVVLSFFPNREKYISKKSDGVLINKSDTKSLYENGGFDDEDE